MSESYLVRIYRRGGLRSRILVGTAEQVGQEEGTFAFHTMDELWTILTAGDPGVGPGPAGGKTGEHAGD